MRQELENLVRNGQFNRAARLLRETKMNKIPREDLATYASIARRIGLPALSLKILNPVLRGNTPSQIPALGEEKIQYAASLRQLGAVPEAIDLLRTVDPNSCPQALLELPFCLIHQWEYSKAIPLLETYLKTANEPPYRLLVAKVNLLGCFAFEELFSQADELIKELRSENLEQSPLLFGNILEISAQLEIKRNNWDAAFANLEQARKLLQDAPNSIHALLIEKWSAIALSQKAEKLQPELQRVRDKAIRLSHWETIRDCDYFSALIAKDAQQMLRVYFGTPYESFRSRAIRTWGNDLKLPQTYYWGEREGQASADKIFDLKAGKIGDESLGAGQAMHRLMIILCRDFYKPVALVSIFSQLFAGEYFSPKDSPNRVKQVIKRLRRWLKDCALPLEIEEVSGSYRFRFQNASLAISIPGDRLSDSGEEIRFQNLSDQLSGTFSTSEAQKVLGESSRNTARLLQWGVQTGKLSTFGRGRNTRYKLVA